MMQHRMALAPMCLACAVTVFGCGWDPGYPETTNTRPQAPRYRSHYKPQSYIVRRGDTLYGIAFRYGLDHQSIANWNKLRAPFTIYPGQRLRLKPDPNAVASRKPASPPRKPEQKATHTTPAASAPAAAPKKAVVSQAKRAPPAAVDKWIWPADGQIVAQFQADNPNRKGIDIAGTSGQAVRAAAAGQVVYSGNGLMGYGELVIIKHSDSLLSAYGHNRKRLVAEGEVVQAGQRVAEMGATGSETTKLHFEIRVDGVPVDPRRYLPNR